MFNSSTLQDSRTWHETALTNGPPSMDATAQGKSLHMIPPQRGQMSALSKLQQFPTSQTPKITEKPAAQQRIVFQGGRPLRGTTLDSILHSRRGRDQAQTQTLIDKYSHREPTSLINQEQTTLQSILQQTLKTTPENLAQAQAQLRTVSHVRNQLARAEPSQHLSQVMAVKVRKRSTTAQRSRPRCPDGSTFFTLTGLDSRVIDMRKNESLLSRKKSSDPQHGSSKPSQMRAQTSQEQITISVNQRHQDFRQQAWDSQKSRSPPAHEGTTQAQAGAMLGAAEMKKLCEVKANFKNWLGQTESGQQSAIILDDLLKVGFFQARKDPKLRKGRSAMSNTGLTQARAGLRSHLNGRSQQPQLINFRNRNMSQGQGQGGRNIARAVSTNPRQKNQSLHTLENSEQHLNTFNTWTLNSLGSSNNSSYVAKKRQQIIQNTNAKKASSTEKDTEKDGEGVEDLSHMQFFENNVIETLILNVRTSGPSNYNLSKLQQQQPLKTTQEVETNKDQIVQVQTIVKNPNSEQLREDPNGMPQLKRVQSISRSQQTDQLQSHVTEESKRSRKILVKNPTSRVQTDSNFTQKEVEVQTNDRLNEQDEKLESLQEDLSVDSAAAQSIRETHAVKQHDSSIKDEQSVKNEEHKSPLQKEESAIDEVLNIQIDPFQYKKEDGGEKQSEWEETSQGAESLTSSQIEQRAAEEAADQLKLEQRKSSPLKVQIPPLNFETIKEFQDDDVVADGHQEEVKANEKDQDTTEVSYSESSAEIKKLQIGGASEPKSSPKKPALASSSKEMHSPAGSPSPPKIVNLEAQESASVVIDLVKDAPPPAGQQTSNEYVLHSDDCDQIVPPVPSKFKPLEIPKQKVPAASTDQSKDSKPEWKDSKAAVQALIQEKTKKEEASNETTELKTQKQADEESDNDLNERDSENEQIRIRILQTLTTVQESSRQGGTTTANKGDKIEESQKTRVVAKELIIGPVAQTSDELFSSKLDQMLITPKNDQQESSPITPPQQSQVVSAPAKDKTEIAKLKVKSAELDGKLVPEDARSSRLNSQRSEISKQLKDSKLYEKSSSSSTLSKIDKFKKDKPVIRVSDWGSARESNKLVGQGLNGSHSVSNLSMTRQKQQIGSGIVVEKEEALQRLCSEVNSKSKKSRSKAGSSFGGSEDDSSSQYDKEKRRLSGAKSNFNQTTRDLPRLLSKLDSFDSLGSSASASVSVKSFLRRHSEVHSSRKKSLRQKISTEWDLLNMIDDICTSKLDFERFQFHEDGIPQETTEIKAPPPEDPVAAICKQEDKEYGDKILDVVQCGISNEKLDLQGIHVDDATLRLREAIYEDFKYLHSDFVMAKSNLKRMSATSQYSLTKKMVKSFSDITSTKQRKTLNSAQDFYLVQTRLDKFIKQSDESAPFNLKPCSGSVKNNSHPRSTVVDFNRNAIQLGVSERTINTGLEPSKKKVVMRQLKTVELGPAQAMNFGRRMLQRQDTQQEKHHDKHKIIIKQTQDPREAKDYQRQRELFSALVKQFNQIESLHLVSFKTSHFDISMKRVSVMGNFNSLSPLKSVVNNLLKQKYSGEKSPSVYGGASRSQSSMIESPSKKFNLSYYLVVDIENEFYGFLNQVKNKQMFFFNLHEQMDQTNFLTTVKQPDYSAIFNSEEADMWGFTDECFQEFIPPKQTSKLNRSMNRNYTMQKFDEEDYEINSTLSSLSSQISSKGSDLNNNKGGKAQARFKRKAINIAKMCEPFFLKYIAINPMSQKLKALGLSEEYRKVMTMTKYDQGLVKSRPEKALLEHFQAGWMKTNYLKISDRYRQQQELKITRQEAREVFFDKQVERQMENVGNQFKHRPEVKTAGIPYYLFESRPEIYISHRVMNPSQYKGLFKTLWRKAFQSVQLIYMEQQIQKQQKRRHRTPKPDSERVCAKQLQITLIDSPQASTAKAAHHSLAAPLQDGSKDSIDKTPATK